MNRAHYLKTDIRRLIKNYPIYLGIVGVAISMWFSLEDSAFTEGMVNGNALDTYGFAVSMSGICLLYTSRVKIAVPVSTDLEDDVIFFVKDF